VLLKNNRYASSPTDADGVSGPAGFGIGWVDAEEADRRLVEASRNTGDLHRIPDQTGGLGAELAAALILFHEALIGRRGGDGHGLDEVVSFSLPVIFQVY